MAIMTKRNTLRYLFEKFFLGSSSYQFRYLNILLCGIKVMERDSPMFIFTATVAFELAFVFIPPEILSLTVPSGRSYIIFFVLIVVRFIVLSMARLAITFPAIFV